MNNEPVEEAEFCQVCGRPVTDEVDRLTWVMDRRCDRISWTCSSCAANNIRAMEAKLEPEWW